MPAPNTESGTVAVEKEATGLLARFAVLKGAVRELWIVFGAKFLAILAYGVMNSTIILWLSSDMGYNDERAGYLVAVWSTVMTLSTVLVGSLVDAIGLRKALLLGFGVCLLSRGVLAFAGVKWLALPFGLFLVAIGESMLTPVMVAAVKRYATTAQRTISFSIFYAMMNLGFGVGAWIFDSVRLGLGEHGAMALPFLGTELTTYRTLFLVSFALTLPNLALIYFFLRDGVEATDEGVKISSKREARADSGKGVAGRIVDVVGKTIKETARIFAGLWRQPAFYKFLVFLSLVVAVRLIFYHMYYTYPKFGIRELGATATLFSKGEIRNLREFTSKLKANADPLSMYLNSHFSEDTRKAVADYPARGAGTQTLKSKLIEELNRVLRGESIYAPERFQGVELRPPTRELMQQNPTGDARIRLNRRLLQDAYPKFLGAGVPIGRLWSINAFAIVLLVPIVGALTQKISSYKMLVVGSFISAGSVFIMAMPPDWFRGAADGWAGNLIAHTWLGIEGSVNPYYVMIFIYVLLLSVGESLWSPRLYEYTAAIAPKGQEASYMSLSYLPFFLAKLVVGLFSGNLLAMYCPETGPRHSETLWLIIALMTIITPVGLLLFRKYIQVKEAGRTE